LPRLQRPFWALPPQRRPFAELTTPNKVLPGFDVNQIAEIAGEIGYENTVVTWSDKTQGVEIDTDAGTFYATPEVCKEGACYGLAISALFGPDTNVPLSAINYFNHHREFTKAYSHEGRLYLTRYEIADFGIPKGNIAHNMSNFVAIATDFADFLTTGAKTSSYEPGQSVQDTIKVLTSKSAKALAGGEAFALESSRHASHEPMRPFNAPKSQQ
jgi:hypothetical protein